MKVYFLSSKIFIFLAIIFIVAFPKAGLKIQGAPITFGYVFIALCTTVAFLKIQNRFKINKKQLYYIMALLPFQSIIIVSHLFYGTTNIPYSISLFVSFIFLPLSFPLIFQTINTFTRERIYKLIKICVFFAATYGIFLFIFKMSTGYFIEIPYLTVNVDDIGALESKHINRGDVFKLISTYNNGNIYAVCMLMLLPLYAHLDKNRINQLIVKSSILLTLSRTAWIGLILYELLNQKSKKTIETIIKNTFSKILLMLIILSAIAIILPLLNWDVSTLFDKNLGGRIEQIDILESIKIIPDKAFTEIAEMTYLSILDNFGLIGLLSFLLALTSPVIIAMLHIKNPTILQKKIAFGLLLYLIIAVSDGAIQYIPVMAIYWLLATLLLMRKS